MALVGAVNDISDFVRLVLEDLARLFRERLMPFVIRATKKLESMSQNISKLLG
jgi:hypothetical protein